MNIEETRQLLKEMGVDFVECYTLNENLQELRPDVTCRAIFKLGLVLDVTESTKAAPFKLQLKRSLLRMVKRLNTVLEKM
jgi:hypothetical protein